jgi:hypothetical protein
MDIIYPNKSFDFTKLTLAQPSGIQGGAYFTKIHYNQMSLYIQTPKSLTKQSIITSGKKMYCDLMFENTLSELIEWFEKLETTCQQMIFDKSDEWFQDKLYLNDIENVFNPILKIYKSGKYYLVRINIKNSIKIYDESRNILSVDDIKLDTNIISILDIQGIKFTSRTFQIEIELKQAMVINNYPIFDNCLIKQNNNISVFSKNDVIPTPNKPSVVMTPDDIPVDDTPVDDTPVDDTPVDDTPVDDMPDYKPYDMPDNDMHDDDKSVECFGNIELDFEDLTFEKDELTEIQEMDPSLSSIHLEPLVLKPPNNVYYKIYREALLKAKKVKEESILAFLEAKNIKETYMLDEIDDSDIETDYLE